jgi:hypothetical protein
MFTITKYMLIVANTMGSEAGQQSSQAGQQPSKF